MADLNKKYQKILDELTQKIKDPKELEFVKMKISELCVEYMASIDKMLEIERKQDKLENKVRKMGRELSMIKEDIYVNDDIDDCSYIGDRMHDNDYEFEITCPYCSYEFLADESCKGEKELECPKCKNIIELDWKEECSGDCTSCGSHCGDSESNEETTDNGSLVVKEDDGASDNNNTNNNNTNNSSNNAKNKNDKQGNTNYQNNNINQALQEDNNEDDM